MKFIVSLFKSIKDKLNLLAIKIKIKKINLGQANLNSYFANALVFTGIISIYFLLCAFLIPSGVNKVFSSALWKIFAAITVFILLVYLFWKINTRKKGFSFKKSYEPFKIIDLVFIFIPLTPITQYIISNQDSLTPLNSVLVFGLFFLIVIMFGIVLPLVLSIIASKKVNITAATSVLTVLSIMAYISSIGGWEGKGLIGIQILIFLGVIIILSIIRLFPQKIVAIGITVFFVVNTLSGLIFQDTSEGNSTSNEKFLVNSVLEGRKIKRTNDVLFIVFESYAENETLKYYGYNNSKQIDFLESNAFHVYKNTYSVAMPTEQSISKVLNIDSDVYRHKKYFVGNGAVQNVLRNVGYKINGVFYSNWFIRGVLKSDIRVDYCFPEPQGVMDSKVFVKAIIMGEFTDTISFATEEDNETYMDEKRKIISNNISTPVFLYCHGTYPDHATSKGVAVEEQAEQKDIYFKRMDKANEEMREDVKQVVKNNPDAIVIFAGDHGPYLTKTGNALHKGRGNFKAADIDRYDVQDRFGMFLAIKWPDKKYANRHDIKILQDVFPAVFSYLYDDDSLFDKLRIKRITKTNHRTLGVSVEDGIIHGGKDDGQKLFLME